MKNLNLIKRLWTDSHEKQSPQRFARYVVMLMMLLTLGVGQMWAYTAHFSLMGDPMNNSWAKDTKYMINTSTGTTDEWFIYAYVAQNQYFALNNGSNQYGPGTNGSTIKNGSGGGQGSYNTNSWKFTGTSGIIKICCAESSSREWYPYVWVEESAPTIKFKHPWNGGSWTEQTATKQSDGTYRFKGQYGGTAGFNAGYSSNFKYNSSATTVTGSPASGDYCYFIWNPVGYVRGTQDYDNGNTQSEHCGTFTIVKLCGLTYDGNGRDGGAAVPSALSDQKYGTSVTLSSAAMTKTGYTLTGWNTANDGSGTHYDLGASFTFSDKTNTLYAEWTQTITVDKNTGTTAGSMSICFNAGSLKTFTAATKTDWVLDSYWTSSDNSGSKVIDYDASTGTASLVSSLSGYITTGKWTRTAATKLYAHWKQTYTVTYNANYPASATSTSGSVPTDATEYASGATVTVKTNSGSLAAGGYTFAGWQTEPTGGTSYVAGSGTFSITEPTTLYAKWSENMTTVTVSVSPSGSGTLTVGGAAHTSGNTTTAGVATSRTVVVTPYPGYRFSSWGTTGNATGTSSTNTYTLKGNGSGSTGTLTATQARTYAYIEGRMTVYNAARNSATHVGSGEGGWSESSFNVAMDYDDTNHRFYRHTYMTPSQLSTSQSSNPQWFSIARTNTSGSWSGKTTYHPSSNQDMSTTGSANKKAAQTSTTTYNYKFNSSVTTGYAILYFDESGVWYELEHTLNYNGNGNTSGNLPASEAYYNNGTSATVEGNTAATPLAKTNYTFAGWNTAQYITGTNYAADASISMTANTTLYAKWTRSITLNRNTATTGSTSVTATYNCATLPSITNPSKDGYTFGGWYTANDGSGSQVINISGALQSGVSNWTTSTRFTRTADGATLYAKWTQTVTLNSNTANHGSGDNKSATVILNKTALSSITHCSPATGYQRTGYYTAATDGTKILNADGSFADNDIEDYIDEDGKWIKEGATTLYAQYEPITYTVTLNPGIGGSGSGTMTVDYDATAYTSFSHSITQTGYSIEGWYTNDNPNVKVLNGNGSFASSSVSGYITGGKWTKASNCDLYAHWTPNPYAITFDATTNGGTISGSSPQNVTFDENEIASCPTATKNGYCFDGWYTKASNGKKVINADGTLVADVTDGSQYTGTGGAWKMTSATTVYAVYTIPTIEMTPNPTVLNSKKTEKDTVVIHQTFSCTPTGLYNVVYTVGYSANHTQLAPQPTIIYGTVAPGYDSIKMPMDANTYEIVAELRSGSTTRGSGTVIKRDTLNYVVEDQYSVTLNYIVDGIKIRDSREVYAYPSSTATQVKVFMEENGYELDYWEMGAGIDSVDGRRGTESGGVLGLLEYKYIYAHNNGHINLHYKSKDNTVYFFNTFEMYWYSTIMKKYDYGTSTSYWANTYGAGSKTGPSTGQITPDDITMTTLSLEEKRWMAPIGASTTNFAFVSEEKDQEHFWGAVAGNEYPHVIYRTDYNAATPMFVPVTKAVHSDYYILNQNDGGEAHYYRGFWVKFSPNPDSTGYYLHVYNQKAQSGAKLIQTLPLRLTQTGEGGTWELTAKMDLEGGKTYGFKVTKATGASTKTWYSYNGTLTAADHEGKVLDGTTNNIGLTTTTAGDYTFHVFCKDFGTKNANTASASEVQGQLAVTVDYATVSGDYRVIYSDATHSEVIASSSIHPRENGQDTVSFFIRKSSASRVMKIQKYTSSWADFGDPVDLSSIAKDSVYVLFLKQNADADNIEVDSIAFYDGDFYIRTDCVDEHKWDYKQSLDNHRMNPSDYGMSESQPVQFTHYYVHWVDEGGNVKFVVANKYAPCISDTLITDTYATGAGGNLPSDGDAETNIGASIRFMYNKGTNEVNRAYLAGAQGKAYDPDYLKMTTSGSKMGTTAATPVVINDITFTDLKNFVYQAEIKAKPGLTAKLTAEYNGNTQYFRGSSTEEEEILGGTGDAWQNILLTYDFKTNRLICAWQPSGDSINGDVPINADVMVIRVGQEDAQQIIFKNNDSKLSSVKYIYSVMQFNYDDMVGNMFYWGPTAYEFCMYYVSFPYDVLVNDIMAPGRMGSEWRLQRYNGAKRAEGWFAGDGVSTFWEDVQSGDTLKAYEGYSLLLNRRIFNDGSSSVWANKGAHSKLYMYFPSKDATTGVVANKRVDVVVPSHECTVDRVFDQDKNKPSDQQRNHKIVDSHWNMIGTPLFEDRVASNITEGPTVEGAAEPMQYIYRWNPAGNTLGIQYALDEDWEFRTMYSYMAQYAGTITFVGSAVNKIVAANRETKKKKYTINLELTKDEQSIGRTYVELRENAVDTFLLNEDVYMVKNGVNADLYTFAGAYEAGANVLSVGSHTIPVGIDVKAADAYTFSMPDNFDGEVILVDSYAQTRTNLLLEDYEIALPTGTINDRFFLEININKTPTAIDGADGGSLKDGKAHKFIMNDMLYILKDGVLYDARGNRVK